ARRDAPAPPRPARAVAEVGGGARPRRSDGARSNGAPGRSEGEAAGPAPRRDGGPGMTGVVYLVGAGPGDPRLITLRGAEVLQNADVVVYDRLVSPALLGLAPIPAERVDAGKEPSGGGDAKQEEINATLIDRATRGKRVVRLKGGDPFVFGRG